MKYWLNLILFFSIWGPLNALSPKESLDIQSLRDVQISPDLTTALVEITQAIEHPPSYQTKIHQIDLLNKNTLKELCPSIDSCYQARWSPDGKTVAFITPVNGINQLYLYSIQNKKASALFESSPGIQTFSWSPDSQKIAFVRQEVSDHSSPPINCLWIYDCTTKKSSLYTDSSYCVRGHGDRGQNEEEFSWSPDGQKIVFAYSPSCELDDFYLDSSLAILDLTSKVITCVKKRAQHESSPFYSPDGKWIAYLASEPPNYALNKRVHVISSDGEKHFSLASTFNSGAELGDRMLLGWTKDSLELIFYEPKFTSSHLVFLPISGENPKEYAYHSGMIQCPTLNINQTALGFIVQDSMQPQEAFFTLIDKLEPLLITQVNKKFKQSSLIKTEIIKWKSRDGLEIEGLLTYPKNYNEDLYYPLILMIHGGPMYLFNQTYIGNPSFFCIQQLSENGFFSLRPNPRGSSGYGKEFRHLIYFDWGGKDYEDLMSGVDEVIKNKKIDAEKLGVMGWSYGGYLTARVITQTTRFKAAIIGAGFCNLVSFAGTTDLVRFPSSYLGEFWQQPEIYHKCSPIYTAHQVQTPCLLVHGINDTRVPSSQAQEFFQALNKNHQVAKMVLIPHMGHGFNQPQALISVMEENLAWFKKHLEVD